MLRRMSANRRALIRKLENTDAFPMIALQAIRELRKDLDAVEAEAIIRARELGASFEDIAEAMEITRQGVAYKLKAVVGESHDDPVDETEDIVDIRGSEADAQAPRQDL